MSVLRNMSTHLSRRKTLLFSTSAAAAAIFALRFRRNQVAARQPSRYVTVDRSGGGV